MKHKIVREIIHSRSNISLLQCRRNVLQEIAEWFHEKSTVDETLHYRENLALLFANASIKRNKQMPLDETDWNRRLVQWMRRNNMTSDDLIKNREVYRLLGIDGFRGYKAKHLKNYFSNLLQNLRPEYRDHTQAVRLLYEWFDTHEALVSLTGTESACIIYLALLTLYAEHLKSLLLDDQILARVKSAQVSAEGFLHERAEHHRDIRKVDDSLLKTLGQIYIDYFRKEEWKCVGHELLLDAPGP